MIEVDVLFDSGPWDEGHLSDLAQAAVTAAIAHAVPQNEGFAVSIMACDSARIAVLNADFRDKAKPTNVLSWPSEERGAAVPGGPPIAPNDPELGDIAIAYEICAREAAEQNKDFDAHVTHLLVHATLHLLGYDHETDGDAALMEGLEVRILGEMGLSDPYMDAVR